MPGAPSEGGEFFRQIDGGMEMRIDGSQIPQEMTQPVPPPESLGSSVWDAFRNALKP